MTDPILITGVGKRLGLALARYCLLENMPVIGTYRTEYAEVEALREAGADLIQCDFYDAIQVSNLIEVVRDKYPALRALVHNASDWLPNSRDESENLEVVERMFKVHSIVPYQLNLAFEAQLRASNAVMSDIIFLTDYIVAKGSQKHIAYAASKAAAENMVKSFAAAFAPKVKVNAIAPALMLFNDGDSDAYKKKTLAKALIQKEGGAKEVIDAFAYLLGSQYMTGRVLHLDGGRPFI